MPLLFLTNELIAPRTLHKSRHWCNCFTNEPIIYSAWDNLPLKLIFRWLLIRYPLSCNMLMRLLHSLFSLLRKSSMHGKAKKGLKDKAWSSISCTTDWIVTVLSPVICLKNIITNFVHVHIVSAICENANRGLLWLWKKKTYNNIQNNNNLKEDAKSTTLCKWSD